MVAVVGLDRVVKGAAVVELERQTKAMTVVGHGGEMKAVAASLLEGEFDRGRHQRLGLG
jgi:hypothetical protein